MKEVFVNYKLDSRNNYYVAVALVFTISLPISTIFPLSVVYGIMGACLYYVVMHACMHECMHVCMNVCMYA